MLRGYAASGAVFHQAHIAQIGHFGTAHALINPAHHIAQNALRVVFHLAHHLRLAPFAVACQGNFQQRFHIGPPPARRQAALHGEDVDLVVMQRVQDGCGGRWDPSAIRARLGMVDLLFQHRRHQIGGCPHSLANLRPPRQATFQADVDILVLVSANPRLTLDEILAAKWPRLHRRMDLIACAVQKASVDKGQAVLCCADAFFEVDRRAPLFIHHADFDGVGLQTQELFHLGKNRIGKGHFFRPVHLGFNDIDRPVVRIAQPCAAQQIMFADQHGDGRIHQPLRHLLALGIQDGGVGHQMADIADPQKCAAFHRQGAAIGSGKAAIFVQGTADAATALVEIGRQRALHQAQPIGIGLHFVFGIDTGHRIFAIHNGRNSAFQHDIGQKRLIARADGMGAVKDKLHVQAVIPQQYGIGSPRIAAVAHKFLGADEWLFINQQNAVFDIIAPHIGVAGTLNRESLVQKHPRPRHNPCAAPAFIAPRRGRAAHSVGAIKRIVQAAPPRIGGVERVARVGDGHHQLRPGDGGYFGVNPLGINLKRRAFGQQIPYFAQEKLISLGIMGLGAFGYVPRIDLGLKLCPPDQKGAVDRGHSLHKVGKPRPKRLDRNAAAGQGLVFHKAG